MKAPAYDFCKQLYTLCSVIWGMFHAKTIVHWKVCVESKIYFMLYNFKERRCPSVLMRMGAQTSKHAFALILDQAVVHCLAERHRTFSVFSALLNSVLNPMKPLSWLKLIFIDELIKIFFLVADCFMQCFIFAFSEKNWQLNSDRRTQCKDVHF